jgi:hypothetical protein
MGVLDEVANRMRADGFDVHPGELPFRGAVIGTKGVFRLRWLATKLHIYIVLIEQDTLDVATFDGLISAANAYAQSKVRWWYRGLQQGVAVVPICICRRATEASIIQASGVPTRKFAFLSYPCIFQADLGKLYMSDEKIVVGVLYDKWIKSMINGILSGSDQ